VGAHERVLAEAERVLAQFEKLGFADAENGVAVRVALAQAQNALGRSADAERTISDTVALQERLLGADHPALAIAVLARGEIRRLADRCPSALEDFERVLALVAERTREAAHALTGAGLCYAQAGQRASAREALTRASALHRELSSDADTVARVEEELAALSD
jgi:serine/threonine-protein kinase